MQDEFLSAKMRGPLFVHAKHYRAKTVDVAAGRLLRFAAVPPDDFCSCHAVFARVWIVGTTHRAKAELLRYFGAGRICHYAEVEARYADCCFFRSAYDPERVAARSRRLFVFPQPRSLQPPA